MGHPGPALVRAALGVGLILPFAAAAAITLAASFGLLPALGGQALGLDPWVRLLDQPGLARSVGVTLLAGLLGTALALGLAFGLVFVMRGREGRLARLLPPFLATPHAALAIGLAFLIAPSGWIGRALSPWATGWLTPPDWPVPQDGAGLSLALGLAVKELPFLALMMLAALPRLPVARHLAAGATLGYGAAQAWAGLVAPELYRLVRLPVYATLAFSLSVVDMALILGPTLPPTLPVAAARWLMAPDLALYLPGLAAATLGAGLVALGFLVWCLAERVAAALLGAWLVRGRRAKGSGRALGFAAAGAGVALALATLSLAALAVWTFAWGWRFPDAWPGRLTLEGWQSAGQAGIWGLAARTAALGVAASLLSVLCAIAWLEAGTRAGREEPGRIERAVWLPLLLPQVALVFGLQVIAARAGLAGAAGAVLWGHVLYAFPYALLALAGPWRRLDPRLLHAGATLGAGPWRRLLTLRLPLLRGPLLAAAALALSVSAALYVPTLFLGAGRIATLTTEAVALASGADRRLGATYALLQAALPLLAFALAALLSRRNGA